MLDNLVVSTALNVIRQELGASIEQLEWTVNAYTLTFAVFLLGVPDLPSRSYLLVKEIILDVAQVFWPAFFLRFFLLFPAPSVVGAVQKRRRLLFLPAILFTAAILVGHGIGGHRSLEGAATLEAVEPGGLGCMQAGQAFERRRVLGIDGQHQLAHGHGLEHEPGSGVAVRSPDQGSQLVLPLAHAAATSWSPMP